MGQGYALSYGAAGAADALTELLKERRFQELQRESAAERARDAQLRERDFELRRQQHARQDEDARALRTQREAQTNRINTQMDKAEARSANLERLVSDPSALAAMAPLQRIVALNNLGVANVGIHDVENPDEHGAHQRGDRDAKFEEWKRQYDYQNHNPRPLRIRGARVAGADDPTLPRGSQAYALEIARKHGTDYDSALAEAQAYLSDPQTQQAHPSLSPQKFLNAIKSGMSRPGGAGGDADLIRQITSGAAPAAGGRGGGASASAQAPGSAEALRAAARHVIRQKLGRDASDEDVDRFLASPRNRQLLGGR